MSMGHHADGGWSTSNVVTSKGLGAWHPNKRRCSRCIATKCNSAQFEGLLVVALVEVQGRQRQLRRNGRPPVAAHAQRLLKALASANQVALHRGASASAVAVASEA